LLVTLQDTAVVGLKEIEWTAQADYVVRNIQLRSHSNITLYYVELRLLPEPLSDAYMQLKSAYVRDTRQLVSWQGVLFVTFPMTLVGSFYTDASPHRISMHLLLTPGSLSYSGNANA